MEKKEEGVEYDVAIGWGYMPIDSLVAAYAAKSFHDHNRDKNIDVDSIPEGSTVLLIGSYWNVDSVLHLQKKVKFVDYYSFSEKDNEKYSGVRLVNYDRDKKLNDCGWAQRIIRREGGESGLADEYFYRGVCLYKGDEGEKFPTNFDMYKYFFSLSYEKMRKLEDELKEVGRIVYRANQLNAKNLVNSHGFTIHVHGYTGRVVLGPATPVLDTTKAAASYQDVDIGVNVRYNHKTDPRKSTTSVSFYTFKESVNLDFVVSEFDGGGRKHAKGCQLEGIREFPTYDIRQLHKRMS